MLHSLKVFSLAACVVAFSASPAIAHDKVNRLKPIPKETLTRIGKDLGELQRAVEKAAEDLAAPPRDVKIICENPVDSIAKMEAGHEMLEQLIGQGYVITKEFSRDSSYVGTGLVLVRSPMGVMAVDTLPGSSAHATGFFQKPFHIKAVDGALTLGQSSDEVRATILGNATAGTGVVLTVAREEGGRDFDRFLMRTRLNLKNKMYCYHLEKLPAK